MILGRPTNLWSGFVTSIIGLVTLLAISSGFDPVTVAQIAGAVTIVAGAAISLIANQTPTVNQGSDINVVTPPGQDNVTIQATVPPLVPER